MEPIETNIVNLIAIRNHLQMLCDKNFIKRIEQTEVNKIIKELDQKIITVEAEK